MPREGEGEGGGGVWKKKKVFALKEKLLCLQKSQPCKGFSAISPHPLGFKEGRQVA